MKKVKEEIQFVHGGRREATWLFKGDNPAAEHNGNLLIFAGVLWTVVLTVCLFGMNLSCDWLIISDRSASAMEKMLSCHASLFNSEMGEWQTWCGSGTHLWATLSLSPSACWQLSVLLLVYTSLSHFFFSPSFCLFSPISLCSLSVCLSVSLSLSLFLSLYCVRIFKVNLRHFLYKPAQSFCALMYAIEQQL